MIYTRLAGGLGNQLFQFAATLALRCDTQFAFELNTDGLKRYEVKRDFDLITLLRLRDNCYSNKPNAMLRMRMGRLLPYFGVNDRNFPQQLARQKSGTLAQALWLDGYFQHGWQTPLFEKVCAEMRDMQRQDLPSLRANDIECVIHIRGGDFLMSKFASVVDVGYYVDALAKLRLLMPELKSAAIVTDDDTYASVVMDAMRRSQPSLNLSLVLPTYASVGPDWLHDFLLLRDARARIIGNSSFAWWAVAMDARHAPTVSPSTWVRGVRRDLFMPWEHIITV